MRKEILDQINDYLEYEQVKNSFAIKSPKRELVGYEIVEYDENEYYPNLYEGGDYIFDELLNQYYRCYFN